ncbi:PAS domain S-box protein [Leeuwenhoekiella sp. ZYFB001]|uniref:PAS domain S-box protein n=1 Tax=Leeuwenhoekiella sp. ZYFB001 TaxID=2719912 RepID=UPI0014304E96|nr:PAS domain S-box protein [Leeuwenhoekiella sp. ZYFB001]
MITNTALAQKFHKLCSESYELSEWLHSQPSLGIFYSELHTQADYFVSPSFWAAMGYTSSTVHAPIDLWEYVIPQESLQLLTTIRQTSVDQANHDFYFRNSKGAKQRITGQHLRHTDSNGQRHLLIRFFNEEEGRKAPKLDCDKIRELQKFNEIYEETNRLALVGGWEVDIASKTVKWTNVTKAIHDVPTDYFPQLETAIAFYKEGWSRDRIMEAFDKCVEQGISNDGEYIIITATGQEKWVRAFMKAEFKNDTCVRVYGAFQDITQQKQQEQSIITTEQRFQKVFENSALGIILIDGSNTIQQTNAVAKEIFGLTKLTAEEVKSYTIKNVIKKEYLAKALLERDRLLAGEIDSYNFEAEFWHTSGRSLWCNITCSLVKEINSENRLIITQVEDITKKKKLERNALEHAYRFKRIFEYSPNGMALVDLEGNWKNINKNLAEIIGYTKEEFLQLTFADFTHPEDLFKDQELLKKLVAKDISTYQVDKRYIHKNGSIVECVLTVSALYDREGNIYSIIGQVVDLTESKADKRALEESLLDHQALLEATSQIIIVETDRNHRIKRFNKGAENLLGYKADEVIGKLYPEVFYVKEEVEAYAKQLEEEYGEKVAIEDVFTFKLGKGKIESNEWNYIKKNGDKLPVQLIVTPIKNEKGEPKGYLKISTDISALKAMETSLLQAKERAEQANQFKSEFLANMSHEIRTPLNGVIGFTDILMQSKLDQNQTKYVETIYSSAVSLLDLLNDILDFSKIESGKLNLSEERVNIADLCARSVEMIRHQAHQKNLEVLLNISTKIEEYILADGLRLRQILINLLSNAVKFTHKGEIELKVQAQDIPDDPNTKRFTFSLRDTGIGIAPQNVKEIFDAFNQGDASTTRKYGGTGLGLTISNRLLELMHSKLEVSSELGSGTTFSFRVNFAIEAKTERATLYSQELKRVLVVDDNQNNRVIIAELLASRKIKTIQAANGIDALEILQKDTDFDLALIDYAMPYLNGLDLIEHIRTDLKVTQERLPIVLLHSSEEDQTINDRCKKLGVHNKLVKPVLRKVLFETMDSLGFSNDQFAQKVDFDAIEDLQDKLTIMVAEDNPVNKFLTRTILNKIAAQANLIEVENGEQAVAAFKKNHIDIILMDIQMPVLSGYEATQQIRALEPKEERVPIIALTARALKGERERCLSYGMDDYISKPLILEDIKAVINAFLERKKITLK